MPHPQTRNNTTPGCSFIESTSLPALKLSTLKPCHLQSPLQMTRRIRCCKFVCNINIYSSNPLNTSVHMLTLFLGYPPTGRSHSPGCRISIFGLTGFTLSSSRLYCDIKYKCFSATCITPGFICGRKIPKTISPLSSDLPELRCIGLYV